MGTRERKRQRRIKDYVISRDGLLCCYCEQVLEPDAVTMEHIVPDSLRGTFNATNLTVSCAKHNNQRGNKPFFDFCKKFNWSKSKMNKYRMLYYNNLKIKVLNIAKEECLPKFAKDGELVSPLSIIQEACNVLKIKGMSFADYEKTYQFEIAFSELSDRKKIKYCFEQLIRLIEAESW